MFDLHTHSILSDGVLLPSELARRYEDKGFRAVAITDHADFSNIKQVVSSIVDFCAKWPKGRIRVLPGVELTHLPPEQFKRAAEYSRKNGIKIIVAHGQTPVEPVVAGTARAALSSDIDILSHPGLISEEDVKLAASRGIFLEISARGGHCLGNGHVARLAIKCGAKLCVNSDSHTPSDIPTVEFLKAVASGAGLSAKEVDKVYRDIESAFFL